MRIISGLRVVAMLAAMLPSGLAVAQAHGPVGFGPGGFGSHPGFGPPRQGIGVNAYAPGQGPVGVAAWNGGAWSGYPKGGAIGWGGGYYGSAPAGAEVSTGGVANVFTYNHFDNRRRDGGFYGGGGVFYGDDGYSRLPVQPVRDAGCAEEAPTASGPGRSGSPYVIELPVSDDLPPVVKKRPQTGAQR
jgi:hypothetical protein